MPFEYDIFISYGHLDDQNPDDVKGWVDLLVERLPAVMQGHLGYTPKVWRDEHSLQGNYHLKAAIEDGISKSLLLVPVITPRYVLSDWCTRELSLFCAATPPAVADVAAHRSRVFKVVKSPLLLPHVKDKEPEQLRDMPGYHFYEMVGAMPVEFGPEVLPSKDKRYWSMLVRLGWEMSDMLVRLKPNGEMPEPAGDAGDEPPPPATASSSDTGVVYLAETASDLTKERNAVRDELQLRGHVVLPEQSLPLDSKKSLDAAVRADLARSVLSVHLVGARYGLLPEDDTPEKDARSVVQAQEELAAERAAADPTFRRIIWMPPGLTTDAPHAADARFKVADERQKNFIRRLQQRVTGGVELLEKTVTIEGLKSLVVESLKPAEEPLTPDRPKQIYLIFEEGDWDLVEPIQSHLIGEDMEVIQWFDESEGESLMKNHHKCLKECDAALIYFGSSDDFWVRYRLDDLDKAPVYGRASKWSARAVYVGAPPHKRKTFFNTPRAIIIRNTEGFDPSKLSDFVMAVRGRNGGRP